MPIYFTDKAIFITKLERLTWDGVCKPSINQYSEVNTGITTANKANVTRSHKSYTRLHYAKSCSLEA